MIVVDASAVIDGLLDARSHSAVSLILSGSAEPLAAPDLLDLEVAGVLRRWEGRGQIATVRAREALEDLLALPIIRYPARALLDEVWRLRHNLTVYDAVYVALANALAARLLTSDNRMRSAAVAADVAVIQLPQ